MKDTFLINKETHDSLIFFCFGFTLDDDYNVILDKIVEKAYVDATNQGAFNTKADSGKAQLAKYSENGSKKIIMERIKLLLDDNVDFDIWHEDTCKELLNIYDANGLKDVFTYGNAQKWVNMTLKYIYLLNGISNNYAKNILDITSKICEYSDSFHVPIDSYIIDVLWTKQEVKLPFKDGVEKDRNKEYSVPSDYIKGWSNWDFDDYNNTYGDLRNLTDEKPIKWETEEWIKRAKERKR